MDRPYASVGGQLDTELVLRTLDELDLRYEWRGAHRDVVRVCSLRRPEAQGLYYAVGSDPAVFDALDHSVVVCGVEMASDPSVLGTNAAIAVEGDVQLVFYRLCARLFAVRPRSGVDPTAVVDAAAEVDPSVEVGPFAVIGRARIGAGTRVGPHAVIADGCVIGARVSIDAHAHVGASGVAWTWGEGGEKVALPLLGGVDVEDDCFIGSGCVVVRGSLNEVTWVGAASMLAPGCKLGHGASIGPGCHLANNVALAGSVTLGARCFLGSGCSIRPHVTLADDTIVGVGAAVVADVDTPGCVLAGVPARVRVSDQPAGVPRRS